MKLIELTCWLALAGVLIFGAQLEQIYLIAEHLEELLGESSEHTLSTSELVIGWMALLAAPLAIVLYAAANVCIFRSPVLSKRLWSWMPVVLWALAVGPVVVMCHYSAPLR